MHKHRKFYAGGLLASALLLVVVCLLLPKFKALADSSAGWLENSTLTLQKDSDLPPGTSVPQSVNGNIDCVQNTMNLTAGKLDTCAIKTSFGLLDSSGHLQFNNAFAAGQVYNFTGYRPGVIGIPGSSTIINYTSPSTPGLNLWFTKNFQSSINTIFDPSTLQTNYQIKKPADAGLRDKANNLLAAQTDSLGFSANGKWMVVDSPYKAMLRVNLDSFEIIPFAPPFNYDLGITPNAQTAVSNDGRYVVVASKSFQVFKVYDLNTCGAVPNVISAPVSCQSKDLQTFVKTQINNFQGLSNLRFLDNNTISFYAGNYTNTNDPSSNHIAKYALSSAGSTKRRIQYLAMGDSYISGEGAYDYVDGTDTDLNHCHLSQKSYPYLVGGLLSFDSFHSVACSGATTNDILNDSNGYKGQLSQKIEWNSRTNMEQQNILGDYYTGVANQLRFVQQYRPGAVTISVSGNDIGFSNILKTCVVADYTCYNTYEDRLELVKQINNKFPTIVQTYQSIKAASPDTKIYAIGYPQVAFVGGNCAANVYLNTEEIAFAQQLITYLDQVIQLASAKAGIVYVDTQNALLGHRLCETKSSAVAVNGLTAGNDKPAILHGPMASESYHPNQLGHQLLEKAVLQETQDLQTPMPGPNSTIKLPAESTLAFLDIPKANRGIYNLNYDEQMTDDVAYRGSLTNIYINGLDYALKPQTAYDVSIHSDVINLGSYATDVSSDLKVPANIPADAPLGFHKIQVTGLSMAGEPVNIYKTIYMAATPTDYNGDGIIDSTNTCDFIGSSGLDDDKDGIDDSCDGYIGDAPTRGVLAQQTATSSLGQSPVATVTANDETGIPANTYANNPNTGQDYPDSSSVLAQANNSEPSNLAKPDNTDPTKTSSATPKKPIRFEPNIFVLIGGIFLAILSTAWIFIS